MAGLFPSIANSQNVDRNGVPLIGSVLTVTFGGAPANCFQDIGLAIVAQNPMTADATGRLPIFYVADGVYAVRLVDQYGVQVYYLPQIASIGASSSGGGGSSVDPTTVFQTGDPIWVPIAGTRTGFVRMNGRTIGSATSGASERANSDCQPLFLHAWNNYTDAVCPVTGGRGVSAAADWAANKKIATLDMRGRGPFGLDGMGNTAAGILTLANLGVDPDTAALAFGEEKHILSILESAAHAHPGSTTPKTSVTDDSGSIAVFGVGNTSPAGGREGGGTQDLFRTDQFQQGFLQSLTVSITSQGGGGAHQNMPPGRLGTWFWKL